MNTKTNFRNWLWLQPGERHAGRAVMLLVLLMLPAAVQAQFNYIVTNGTVTITAYTGPGGAVTIPSTIVGLPVTDIGYEAFSGCSSLTSLTIPNSVTNIGDQTFWYCTSLTSVTIGTSVKSIGDSAFFNCAGLRSITIPNSVTSLGRFNGQVFYDCTGLTNVALPNSLTYIQGSTFAGCSSLTSLTIPNSVTIIGGRAFFGCTSLTSVTIPNSVTEIESGAFYECTGITNVTIGTGVTGFLPGSYYAFADCTSLEGIYFEGNAPGYWDLSVLSNDTHVTVYYLPGTTGWFPTWAGRPTALWNPRVQTNDPTFGVRTNQFGFTVTGTVNIPIVIEASSDLASSTWSQLQNCTLTNGSIYFSDAQWKNYPARFYRIRWP